VHEWDCREGIGGVCWRMGDWRNVVMHAIGEICQVGWASGEGLTLQL